jgi:hypothetical protein
MKMIARDVIKNRLSVCKPLAQALALIVACLVFCASTTTAQPPERKPLKILVQSQTQSLRAGEAVEIEMILQDANNQTVKALRDMTVTIEVRLPSGKVDSSAATIRAGESSQKLRLPLNEPGLNYIWVKHAELLGGGVHVNVKPSGSMIPRQPFVPLELRKLILTLRHSPQRRLLADGKDAATIQAFILDADSLATDVRVRLFNSGGTMMPQPLVIPRGQDLGTSTLTSDKVDTVTVEYLSSTPPAELQGETKLSIPFAPPITRLELKASPPLITLAERTELIVRLLDDNNNPVATDEPRPISFAIESGRGEIEAEEITIMPGKFEGRTTFLPTWRGQVNLSASTRNLPSDTFSLKVTLPVLLLSLSALGGIIGGLIDFWVRKNSRWWRMAIGLVTGFVLYWAFVFGVITILPRAIVLNPLSTFALSTLGGWLGTEVFTIVLKRLGILS